MKRLTAWPVALALVAALGGCRKKPSGEPRVNVNGTIFRVELAMDDASRARGLGGRLNLPADQGMLFIFDEPRELTFHMKDCYFPIDLAFLDADRKILNLETMAVEPDPTRPWEHYSSAGAAKYALEVPGGTWTRIGATPGMTVAFIDVPEGP